MNTTNLSDSKIEALTKRGQDAANAGTIGHELDRQLAAERMPREHRKIVRQAFNAAVETNLLSF